MQNTIKSAIILAKHIEQLEGVGGMMFMGYTTDANTAYCNWSVHEDYLYQEDVVNYLESEYQKSAFTFRAVGRWLGWELSEYQPDEYTDFVVSIDIDPHRYPHQVPTPHDLQLLKKLFSI